MMRLRIAGLVAVVGVGVTLAWLAGRGRSDGPAVDTTADQAAAAYDYEATDVVVRQMDATGRLHYQADARRVTQLPRSGEISAEGLTLRHDPPSAPPGSDQRWTLTADRAVLPAAGDVLTLAGTVRASGRPATSTLPVRLATEELRYDLDAQVLSTPAEVELQWGGNVLRGRNLRIDARTSDVALESRVHGTLVP